MSARRVAVWGAVVLAAAAVVLYWIGGRTKGNLVCGPGFSPLGSRCCAGPPTSGSACVAPPICPVPLRPSEGGCDAPDDRVAVAATTLALGPSDWEAEGRVQARTVHAASFWLDAFEATVGHVRPDETADRARAASGLTRQAAADYCARRGGRLPTEDEWIAAAAGSTGRRYPWGDTGAVCRRAAFGLATGPCANGGVGPDTVGAHGSGDTPTGLHDMAGNVAEWVAPAPGEERRGIARGGSWRSALATELRTWARLELDPGATDDRVGVRCAYDSP